MRVRYVAISCLLLGLGSACRSQEADQGPSTNAPAARPVQAGFHVGDERRYRLHLVSEATIQGQPLTQFELSATWVVRTADDAGGRRLLHTTLEGVQITSKYPQIAAQMQGLGPELAKPFGVELGRDGALTGYRFVDAPSPLVVGIRQTMALGLQVSSRPGETSWSSEELDSTGRFRAQYERKPDGSLLRRKLAYTSLKATMSNGASAQSLLPRIEASSATLRLDAGGALEAFDGEERLASGSGQIAPIDSATQLTLTVAQPAAPSSVPAPLLFAALKAGQQLAADAAWSAGVKDEQFDAARIGDYTLAKVLAELRALVASTGPDKALPERQRADLFTALSAIIRSQPESRRQVIALVQQGDKLTSILLDALGAAGESESQRALAGFLDKPGHDAKQLRAAAIALSHTKNPTPEATAALVKLLDVQGLRTQALYGLGTQINTLRAAGDEKTAKAVLAVVLERLKLADDPVERITALRAVANSGHGDAFPAILPYLKAGKEEIRAAAVESLQLMSLPQVDEIIAKSLSDQASIVRRAAARAAALREPTPVLVSAVESAAQNDESSQVRLMALGVLGRYRPKHPELGAVIRGIAQNDPDETVRREAAKAADAVSESAQASK